ncbi:hypothetical protein HGQ17_01120 [Nesterenkonia sp. MY13]|uniref:Uncharacterized protein n=1 Tax=Nesterenkonia sedimenti TaxID=1463632 RepID=A0A7X8THN1_9MICC|nr:hypothetical protein [Nesterenkonia sedimenti]NLS08627.1 hypothetical protein [Nesterenkonia sedimenti]
MLDAAFAGEFAAHDVLDLLEGTGIDQGWVLAVMDDSFIGDLADVVGVAQDVLHGFAVQFP